MTDGFDEAYRRVGGDPELDQEFIKSVMYESDVGNIPSSLPVIAEHLGISTEQWSQAVNRDRGINYDLLEYIKELKKDYKIAMLSNIGSAGVRRFFPDGLLEQHFDPIIESGVIGFAKPEPRAYEVTVDRLGVRLDECIFTDDRQDYVDGAIAVGMKAVLYQNLDKFKKDLGQLLEG